jgi:hypothetical protein
VEHTGEPIHYVSSTIVPSDESFYCVIEAATEEGGRGAYARAGIPFGTDLASYPSGRLGYARARR